MVDLKPIPTHDPHELHPSPKFMSIVTIALIAVFAVAVIVGVLALAPQR